jgi:hypothetical protein
VPYLLASAGVQLLGLTRLSKLPVARVGHPCEGAGICIPTTQVAMPVVILLERPLQSWQKQQ